MTTMTEPTTRTLEVPGAVLTYDIRSAEPGTSAPVLFVIGSPMGASGFGTLAGHFADRTVVTYDPRGVERSTKADPTSPSTPEEPPRSIGSSPRSWPTWTPARSTSSPAAAAP